MPRFIHFLSLSALPAALAVAGHAPVPHPRPAAARPVRAIPAPVDSAFLKTFRWRNIGPERGGRSIAVSGVRG
ncbi:MAG: hypothetical protein KGO03_12165, partial [Gemmatimonadota bacterium]|nr:hypothetical protein [Gemmatimonadota bacterium]